MSYICIVTQYTILLPVIDIIQAYFYTVLFIILLSDFAREIHSFEYPVKFHWLRLQKNKTLSIAGFWLRMCHETRQFPAQGFTWRSHGQLYVFLVTLAVHPFIGPVSLAKWPHHWRCVMNNVLGDLSKGELWVHLLFISYFTRGSVHGCYPNVPGCGHVFWAGGVTMWRWVHFSNKICN